MTVPAQKPGKSKQDYGTPDNLKVAVENRFGKIICDLAATTGQRLLMYAIWKGEAGVF